MAKSEPGMYQKSVRGGQWILYTTVLQRFLNLGTFFILARLISPADYGVMAVVFMITGFFDVMTAPGFEKALMQRANSPEQTVDTVWTVGLLRSVLIMLVLWFATPVLANFFHIEAYAYVLQWGAFLVLVGSLSSSHQFFVFRNLDFKKIFWRDIISQIAYMVVAISWAMWYSPTVSALLAGHVTRYVVSMIMTYIIAPHWPRLSLSYKKLKELFGYSRWVAGQNIFNYILGILDSVYIGRLLDTAALGFYTKARDLAFAPFSPFTNIINRVGFPAYARLQDKEARIQQGFLRTLDVILGVGLPIVLVLVAEAGVIVEVILGPTWFGLVVPLKILAMATLFGSLVTLTKPVFDALGRPDISFRLVLMQLISSVVLVYVGIKSGQLIGVALAILVTWAFNFGFAFYQVKTLLKLEWNQFKPTILPLIKTMGILLFLTVPFYVLGFKEVNNPWVVGLVLSVLGLGYVGLLWFFGHKQAAGPWITFISIIQEIRGQFKKSANSL